MTNDPFLQVPHGEKRVLLHTCCAPCSCSILRRLIDGGIVPTVYFYNPNIFPREEYEHRKGEVLRYIQKKGIFFIDADYDCGRWDDAVRGHEEDRERGERCAICFDLRLGKAAAYAAANGFTVFATTLGISRWKDLEQVNQSGTRAAASFPGLVFWANNWRLQGGQELMEKISREENFYRQKYCGCRYSLEDSRKRARMRRTPS